MPLARTRGMLSVGVIRRLEGAAHHGLADTLFKVLLGKDIRVLRVFGLFSFAPFGEAHGHIAIAYFKDFWCVRVGFKHELLTFVFAFIDPYVLLVAHFVDTFIRNLVAVDRGL